MKEIISIVNQKGGSGKTTTAIALGTGLKKRGFKVLFVDLDGQANLTNTIGIDKNRGSLFDLLTKRASVWDIIQKTSGGDILPGSESLFQMDTITTSHKGKEYLLEEALGDIKGEYDYIILDTPPALSVLTLNALFASTDVIIASQADWYNFSGVDRITKIIGSICQHRNKSLDIRGILLTRFTERTILNKEFANLIDEFAGKLGTKIFRTKIRNSIVISEAQAKHMTIFDYASTSNVARDYEAFINEFLKID